ncbi:putative holin-like toxin [Bacillus infantis]
MITADIANVILAFGTFVLTLVMVVIMLITQKK